MVNKPADTSEKIPVIMAAAKRSLSLVMTMAITMRKPKRMISIGIIRLSFTRAGAHPFGVGRLDEGVSRGGTCEQNEHP